MALLLLALALVASLLMIPLGLPGTWLMLASAIGYNVLVGGDPIGWWTIGLTLAVATVGEIIEFSLSSKYARKYGGSRRAGWGAIIGGLVGAFMGFPVPIVGPVIGAFIGSFVGALAMEYTRERNAQLSTRVATGALIGRAAAMAVKTGLGCVIAVWLFWAAWM